MVLASPQIVRALSQPTEVTLNDLIDEYGLSNLGTLDALARIQEVLTRWNIALVPEIGHGSLDQVRILTGRSLADTERRFRDDISQGECQEIEFKQSLALDVDKHVKGGQPIDRCYSEEVLISALKTIAGFMNSSGGKLLIGIDDDGEPVGLERELALVCPKGNTSKDGWELSLRAKLEKYLIDGAALQSYLKCEFCELGGRLVARLNVGTRSRLTFLKLGDQERLYLRVGNRTQNVRLSQIEDYLAVSRPQAVPLG